MTNHERKLEGRIRNLEELFLLHQQALEDAADVISTLYEMNRKSLFLSTRQGGPERH